MRSPEMYAHTRTSSQATLYVFHPEKGFRPSINIPLNDLHPDIATLLRVKARLCDGFVNVYLNSDGEVIDTPKELPL